MTEKSDKTVLREADNSDIQQLSIHHRKMFEEIWQKKGEQIDIAICNEIEKSYARKLTQELADKTCKSWVIEYEKSIISSGAVTIVRLVPTPDDLSSNVAYLHSVYTEKEYRNKNFASRIVQQALQYCRDNGIRRIFLNASEAGKTIYQKIGFRSSPETMRLFIK